MTLHLVLLLAALIPETKAQEWVRDLEEQLRQFPSAEVVAYNLDSSFQHISWLREAGAAIPTHRREVYAAHLADAERLQNAWLYLDRANRTLQLARHIADGGRIYDDGLYKPPDTVRSFLSTAAHYIEALETLLGEEAFRAGRMPPPVPYWRFQWID
jgi:hypothetical protein